MTEGRNEGKKEKDGQWWGLGVSGSTGQVKLLPPPLSSCDSGEEALQHASTDVVALSGAPAQRGASSH